MSSIFEAYDEEFLALTQDIGNNISHLSTYETDSGGWWAVLSVLFVSFWQGTRCWFTHFEDRALIEEFFFPSLRRNRTDYYTKKANRRVLHVEIIKYHPAYSRVSHGSGCFSP